MYLGGIKFKYNSCDMPVRPRVAGGSHVRMNAEFLERKNLLFEVSEEQAQQASDYFLNFIKECKKRN